MGSGVSRLYEILETIIIFLLCFIFFNPFMFEVAVSRLDCVCFNVFFFLNADCLF